MNDIETKIIPTREAGTPPQSFDQWLTIKAQEDETFAFLWEQIKLLQTQTKEQEEIINKLTMELTNLKAGVVAHKHAAETGESTIPAGMVLRIGQ